MTHLYMNLTAGTTLQNQKYVIQKLLDQSDLSVTYQAQHAYLEQPVILQSLNENLRQRSDFAQLQQQFLAKVRSQAQQTLGAARVLDCFSEQGIPFVVFERVPGQPLPQFTDWFSVLPIQTVDSNDSNQTVVSVASPETVFATAFSDPATHSIFSEGTLPPTPAPAQTFQQITPQDSPSLAMVGTEIADIPQPKLRSKALMPLALIFVTMMGGILGAGFGLSLRLASTRPQADGNSSRLTPSLFSREQTFPAKADWPISETPQRFTSPITVEEPVYRVNPTFETYSENDLQPLPHIQDPPILPSDSPTSAKASTLSQPSPSPAFSTPSPSAPSTADIPSTTSLSDDILNTPIQPNPIEPAPAPIIPAPAADPVLPPAPAPELPVPEAKSAPALPVQQPPVIKQ